MWPAAASSHGCNTGQGVISAVFARDGARIGTASVDHTAGIWDAASGRELVRLTHSQRVRSIAFSPDGRRVVTTCDDGARPGRVGCARQQRRRHGTFAARHGRIRRGKSARARASGSGEPVSLVTHYSICRLLSRRIPANVAADRHNPAGAWQAATSACGCCRRCRSTRLAWRRRSRCSVCRLRWRRRASWPAGRHVGVLRACSPGAHHSPSVGSPPC